MCCCSKPTCRDDEQDEDSRYGVSCLGASMFVLFACGRVSSFFQRHLSINGTTLTYQVLLLMMKQIARIITVNRHAMTWQPLLLLLLEKYLLGKVDLAQFVYRHHFRL